MIHSVIFFTCLCLFTFLLMFVRLVVSFFRSVFRSFIRSYVPFFILKFRRSISYLIQNCMLFYIYYEAVSLNLIWSVRWSIYIFEHQISDLSKTMFQLSVNEYGQLKCFPAFQVQCQLEQSSLLLFYFVICPLFLCLSVCLFSYYVALIL